MTIKKRLIISTISINVILLIIGMTFLFGYRHVTSKASLANDFDKESMYLQMMLRGLNESILNEGTADSVLTGREGLDGFNAIHDRLRTEIYDPDVLEVLIKDIDPRWQRIKHDVDPLFKEFVNLHDDDTLILAGKLITETEGIFTIVKALSERTRAVVNKNSTNSVIIQYLMIAVIIGMLLSSVFFSYRMYSAVTSPINELNMIAEGFSKGDLSVTMDESRKDEFGLLALHFNRSIAKLNQYTKELQDFAHIASHDLQEPLRKILAFSDRLKNNHSESLGEKGLNYLDRMYSAAGRMQRLVESLLVYSQVIKHEKPFEQVDLQEVTRDVLSDLEVRIEELGGRVEVEDMPLLKADPLQMRQLFQNLIGNALKFHKADGSPVIRIKSMTSINESNDQKQVPQDSQFCQIIFEDNGIGFEEKYVDRIFKVFQRLHGQSEYEGTGIGLSICRKIVERHGGSIKAESSPGTGAKFIVSLPVDSHEGGLNG